jgi:hypothetical protein
MDGIMKIVRSEGIGGIYRGVGATVAKQGTYHDVYHGIPCIILTRSCLFM